MLAHMYMQIARREAEIDRLATLLEAANPVRPLFPEKGAPHSEQQRIAQLDTQARTRIVIAQT